MRPRMAALAALMLLGRPFFAVAGEPSGQEGTVHIQGRLLEQDCDGSRSVAGAFSLLVLEGAPASFSSHTIVAGAAVTSRKKGKVRVRVTAGEMGSSGPPQRVESWLGPANVLKIPLGRFVLEVRAHPTMAE